MPAHNTETQVESQRSQELRKYFAPIIHSDVGNAETRRQFNENLQNDGVLLSLTEAVMLRLSATRAMVSFVDSKVQYFVAGALNNEINSVADSCTWFGCHNIDTVGGFGECTLSARYDGCEYPIYTVNDLLLDDFYKDMPYVDGTQANYRFYAGTPITTDRNINIGILFIFGDEPRPQGLTDFQKHYLVQSAERVLNHLEMRRIAKERHRLACMSEGIAKFLQGKFEHVSSKEHEINNPAKSKSSSSMAEQGFGSAGTPKDVNEDTEVEKNAPPIGQGNTTSQRSQSKQFEESPQEQIERTLHLAAKLLRESLEIVSGGVAFFDTIAEYPQNLDNKMQDAKKPDLESPSVRLKSCSEKPDNFRKSFHLPRLYEGLENGPARVMAEAQSLDDTVDLSKVSSEMVRGLIETYSEGNIWHFDEKGYFTSLEQLEASTIKLTSSSGSSQCESQSQEERDMEARKIAMNFGCRQLIFLPFWSAETKQWFAGCFVWTHSSIPVFTVSSEIGYLASFANSVMTELSRIDAIALNRVKSDFISSISHEFRSPLHGILASADFLQETDYSEAQSELISTIQNCGRTLLDTINHVLDFTKINFSEQSSNQTHPKHNGTNNTHYSMANIAVLCEEVVDGMIVSDVHHDVSEFTKRRESIRTESDPNFLGSEFTSKVNVNLDFEARDWSFMTMPGAIRRIIMNIFGNAQKYTDEGFINVSLQAIDGEMLSPDESGTSQAKTAVMILLVQDSGCGMSPEFLQRNLYTPFVQESTLSAGAGLGLSIVRSIVSQLSGSIKVRSVKNKGTEVEIRVPLERTLSWNMIQQSKFQPEDILCSTFEADKCLASVRKLAPGVTISLKAKGINFSENQSTSSMIAVQYYLSTWFGFQLQHFSTWASAETSESALVICDEIDAEGFIEESRYHDYSTPILMICSLSTCLEKRRRSLSTNTVEYLSKPVGPCKLARHLLDILTRSKNSKANSSQTSEPPLTTSEHKNLQTQLPNRSVSRPLEQHIPSPVNPLKTQTSPTGPKTTPNPDLTPLSILIVDDNEVNLKLLKKYLDKRQGDTVDMAHDGLQALEAAKQATPRYDIIFMDLSMPIMDGFESTRRIREYEAERFAESGQRQDAFIVALTGLGAKEPREAAEKCGTNAFLTKPLPFKRLGSLLIERSQARFAKLEEINKT